MSRFAIAAGLAIVACQPAAKPTPDGTVLVEWKQTTTALSTGVGIGAPIGAPVRETKTVEFTPGDEVRDKSLKPARLELTLERQDVALTPNSAGARPAERAAVPMNLSVKLLESGGWHFEKATCATFDGPGDIGERLDRVGFWEVCSFPMRGGREDIANVVLTVAGNGAHKASASFGTVTLR